MSEIKPSQEQIEAGRKFCSDEDRIVTVGGSVARLAELFASREQAAQERMRERCYETAKAHWGGVDCPECGDPNACCGEAIAEHIRALPVEGEE